MLRYRAFYVVLPILILSVFISFKVNAQTYLPIGPQTNVPEATVTGGGWTECYRDLYSNHLPINRVLALCSGDRLLLSCRQTGSDTLTLLAQGDRIDVTFDTGFNSDVVHIANGVGWYFNTTFIEGFVVGASWGFVRAGDSVLKINCDTETSGANDERLCWHLQPNTGGWRCGVTQNLNESDSFERIIYTNAIPSIPTLSEWGMISAAAGLGLVGAFFALKRRKAQIGA